MRHAPRTIRLISMLMVLALAAGACSSSDGEADTSADRADTTTESGDSAEEPDAGEAPLSCEEVGEPAALLRGANGWIIQVVDADSDALLGGDYEALLQAIEDLRPIQDIEGLFGTMRQGLDNLEADVIAIQEGRYDDKVGEYGIVTMNAVVVEEICG